MKYRQLPKKKLWKIRQALPLQEDDEGRGFVEFMMSLGQALQDILSLDPRTTSRALSWEPGWHVPLRKCLWDSVNPRSSRSSSLNSMLISCMEQVEGAMDAGSSGERAYRLLVSELRRELYTRVCGAALQKLIAEGVGEGVPFSDCYRSFRTVAHDAKSDGQFAANFNIVLSIVFVLMSQQYPTLYEITFSRNTPNRYFLDESQMWKALDLLKRNMTRSLAPRSDTGARVSSGGGAPGVVRVLQKSRVRRVLLGFQKKTISKQIFHRGRHQWRHGVRCIIPEMTAIHRYLHGFPTIKPSQLCSGNSLDNI